MSKNYHVDRSERYFDSVRYSRGGPVPASYSSVDLGLVSPVKNQVGMEISQFRFKRLS